MQARWLDSNTQSQDQKVKWSTTGQKRQTIIYQIGGRDMLDPYLDQKNCIKYSFTPSQNVLIPFTLQNHFDSDTGIQIDFVLHGTQHYDTKHFHSGHQNQHNDTKPSP